MEIYNPGPHLFIELEHFLRYYYNYIEYPISIHHTTSQYSAQILYNVEQLTVPSAKHFAAGQKNKKGLIEIWDYSESNIAIWNCLGIYNVKYVPPKIWPHYKQQLLSYNTTNDYLFDVGFVGWVNGVRRTRILQDIASSNISVDIITDSYGEDRDRRLTNCKIILNIHYSQEYQIFEKLRCFAWLDIDKIVVSENSLDNDPRCINVNYHDIVPKLKEILKK